MSNDAANKRRAQRRAVSVTLPVTDAIRAETIGHIGNLSRTGLMLISPHPLREDALYQLSFTLPDTHTGQRTLEIGMQQQWSDTPGTPGQYWTGLRFISISDDDDAALARWLQASA